MKSASHRMPAPPSGIVIKRVHTAPSALKKLPRATRRHLEAFRALAIAELARASKRPPSSAPLRRRDIITGSARLTLVG